MKKAGVTSLFDNLFNMNLLMGSRSRIGVFLNFRGYGHSIIAIWWGSFGRFVLSAGSPIRHFRCGMPRDPRKLQ